MMIFRGLSDLHIIPRDQTVTADYYVQEVLKKMATCTIRRKKENCPPAKAKLLPEAIFQQDGAPAHRARKTQVWFRATFPDFWAKHEWPGNSSGLSPIENLWALVQQKLNPMIPATSEETLISKLRTAWSCISAEALENLMSGMPDPIRANLKERGDTSANKP